MKFLIIGDLHGKKPKIKVKDFDYVIVPGDVCSDNHFRPIWKKYFKYYNLCEKKETIPLDLDTFIKKKLKIKASEMNKKERESLKKGNQILKFLDSFGKPIFFVPGNWDQSYPQEEFATGTLLRRQRSIYKHFTYPTNPKLKKGLKNLRDAHLKLYKLKEFNFIGYGLTQIPEIPHGRRVKNKKHLVTMKKIYNKLFDRLKNPYMRRNKKVPTILLSHNVPFNTKLDLVNNPNTWAHKQHYGSKITRDFIKKYQPAICIGGHIHENKGKIKIGKTICINAGFGPNVNTTFEIKNGKIKNIKFLGENAA